MTYRNFNAKQHQNTLVYIFDELLAFPNPKNNDLRKILAKFPKEDGQVFSKDQLIEGLRFLKQEKLIPNDVKMPSILKMKPTRTISGVTTVTVLTKPYPCPGKCIFCPNDIRMPKSYIASEPGAQRALVNRFSPYLQVYNRLRALEKIGHPTEKIELLVLGGTWSYYPKGYQIWFIKECFKALNDFGTTTHRSNDNQTQPLPHEGNINNTINETLRNSMGDKTYNELINTKEYKVQFKSKIANEEIATWEELKYEQDANITAKSRCVGLVLETRPDALNPREVLSLRKLGATKIQIGVQTLDNKVSEANKRGETSAQVAEAFKLLRHAGFKIHAHVMPNLYRATIESDLDTYKTLFESKEFKPDELKIYPTSVIKNTELYTLSKEGKYKPYSQDELIELLSKCIEITPEYCRLTRIIRDIPSTEITTGNKITNLRQVIENKLQKEGRQNKNIRAREVKSLDLSKEQLELDISEYQTSISSEYFLQYITQTRKIAGFLRLSIPHKTNLSNPVTEELSNTAIIREIHVYGPSLKIGSTSSGQAQHLGLGTKLLDKAAEIALDNGFSKISVISAIGTKEYYKKRGFHEGVLYQHRDLKPRKQ